MAGGRGVRRVRTLLRGRGGSVSDGMGLGGGV